LARHEAAQACNTARIFISLGFAAFFDAVNRPTTVQRDRMGNGDGGFRRRKVK